MRRASKVIITCAVTGGVHTPSMSPHLPVSPAEIANQAVAAAKAGAAILHLHARNPVDGRPSQNADLFDQFLPIIRATCDAVINITTGGGLGMSLAERLAPAHRARPELASLNMGSMNFGIFQLADKAIDWKHDWEQDYLRMTRDFIYPNTFAMIEQILVDVGQAYRTRFEFECYDIGHLYTLKHFADRGLVKPPFFIQAILGVQGGIGAHPDHLVHMRQTADRLFGDDYLLSCIGVGRAQLSLLALNASMGGAVRVGLEDNLYIARGKLARSNAEQVVQIRQLIEGLGFEIATPDEAREILGITTTERVAA